MGRKLRRARGGDEEQSEMAEGLRRRPKEGTRNPLIKITIDA